LAVELNGLKNWRGADNGALKLAQQLVENNDGEFGKAPMLYKFSNYYSDTDSLQDRTDCKPFLDAFETRLSSQSFMYGDEFSVADVPIFPAVNGFSKIEPEWFAGRFPNLAQWIEKTSASPHIQRVNLAILSGNSNKQRERKIIIKTYVYGRTLASPSYFQQK